MAKAGRKRKHGRREPNGQLSRRAAEVMLRENETERQIMDTVISARCRRFGVTDAVARNPLAGTAVGRMCLARELTMDQYDAAQRYLDARKAYHGAIMAKSDVGDNGGGKAAGDKVSEAYAEWCRRAKERWTAVNQVLDELTIAHRSPAPRAALDAIVVRDVDVHELTGDLRVALNAIDRHFSGEKRRAA